MENGKYLFVDGGYLRKALASISRKYFGSDEIPLAASRLTRGFRKTFFYDCPAPIHDPATGEQQARVVAQRALFDALRRTTGVHVIEGVTVGKTPRQKQVDVAIAVDMLTHSYRRNMVQATLLTGDLDFKPVVDALVRDGCFVTLWYDPSSTNRELIYAADEQRILGRDAARDMAADEFREKHPDAGRVGGTFPGSEPPLRTGRTVDGRTVSLHRYNGVHAIVFHGKTAEHDHWYTLPEAEHIELYAKEIAGEFSWLP